MTATIDYSPLIELVHHRWNIPVLAELYRQKGAKFVALCNALGVSRSSLSLSLADLSQLGLVHRNPGYGHPMRPEYLLTPRGRQIGKHCLALTQLLRRRNEAELAFSKWTLPLVAAIGRELRRFNQVQAALADATPRAITLGLKALLENGWVVRSVEDDYPPTAAYALRARAQPVYRRVQKLVSSVCGAAATGVCR